MEEQQQGYAGQQPQAYGGGAAQPQQGYAPGTQTGAGAYGSNGGAGSPQGGGFGRQQDRGALRMCKYGMGCTRVECWFQHPEGWTAEKAVASSIEETLYLDPEDIPKLIGPGGSTIKQLCTQSGSKAHVNKAEDGRSAIKDGKAYVTLMGPQTGVNRFKAMVKAKLAEIKLRAAGQWTDEMQRQQNELMGTRDTVESGSREAAWGNGWQRPAYTAHNTAHNDASKAGHYQQLFTSDGREYFCNTANRKTQWERPPPGSTIVPGKRTQPQQAVVPTMAAQPAAATPADGQPVKAGTVLNAQNASVMPFQAALAATGQSLAVQVPSVSPYAQMQQMQQSSPASPREAAAQQQTTSPTVAPASSTAANEPLADPAQELFGKQYRNFQVYGGYYTANHQWVQGAPAKPDGVAVPVAAPAAAPAAAAAAASGVTPATDPL
jgi:hypothetical protein